VRCPGRTFVTPADRDFEPDAAGLRHRIDSTVPAFSALRAAESYGAGSRTRSCRVAPCHAVNRHRCSDRRARDEHRGVRMAATMTGAAVQPEPSGRRRSGLARAIVVIALVLAAWLIVRSSPLRGGRSGLLHPRPRRRGDRRKCRGPVRGPGHPSLRVVSISGDVIEAGRTSPAYRSAMLIVVEPFTGSVVVFGAG